MADQTRSKAGGNQPISRHPLFPAIVALWFGALFGLVGVVIEPALIERAVVATGIDSVLPMAAPPLGATARILLALAMTGLGGVIGALIARRIARPQQEMPGRRRRAASRAESGAPAALSAAVPAPARRADKPAREAAILNVAEFDLGGYIEDEKETAAAQENPREDRHEGSEAAPLALADLSAAAPEEQKWLDEEPMAPAPEPASCADPSEGNSIEGRGVLSNPLFESYSRQISARPVHAANESDHGGDDLNSDDRGSDDAAHADAEIGGLQEESERGNAAERIATAELDALSQVELLERLALAMARRRDEIARAAASGVPEPLEVLESLELREPLEVVEAAAMEPETEPCLAADLEPAPQASAPRPFRPLSFETPHLETVPVSAPAEPEGEPEVGVEAGGPEIHHEAPRVPAALRPVAYHAHDEDDVLPGYIPPRHIGIAPDAKDADAVHAASIPFDDEAYEDEEEEDGDVLNEGYSSLLDLSRSSAARPFPRIEDPDEPDVDGEAQAWGIFPGENPRDAGTPGDPESPTTGRLPSSASERPFDAPDGHRPDETERALRAALATLQRMSGAA